MQNLSAHHIYKPTTMLTSLVFTLFLGLSVLCPGSQLISSENEISDFDAKSMLARVLSYSDKTLAESLSRYEELLEEKSRTFEIQKEMAMIYMRLGKHKEAEGIIKPLFKSHPDDPFILQAMADMEALYGHAAKCKELYESAIAKSPDKSKILLDFALAMQMWGDFYGAEKIFRDRIRKEPSDMETTACLARLLKSTLRHEEAAAFNINPAFKKEVRTSDQLPQDINKSHAHISEQFRTAFLDKANTEETARTVAESGKWSAIELTRLAELCTKNGMTEPAGILFRKATRLDPDNFLSTIGLAETLASLGRFKEALEIYERLDHTFPDNWKIIIEKARLLGWSRQYKTSLEEYRKLHELNPSDPVPLREMARVAAWGNMIEQAVSFYDEILSPSVDEMFAAELLPLAERTKSTILKKAVNILTRKRPENQGYIGFEKISTNLTEYCSDLAPGDRETIEASIAKLKPYYKIQKQAWLEKRTKTLQKNKKYIHALSTCKELLDFEPDNQETIFDYAQHLYSAGLTDQSEIMYRQLLDISPLHSLAPVTLEREESLTHPEIRINEYYWNENGRGNIAQISRNRNDLAMEFPLLPVLPRTRMEISGNLWQEKTPIEKQTRQAKGITAAANTTFNEYLSASACYTIKQYLSDNFHDTDSGYLNLRANLLDYAAVGLEFERSDEIYNYFGMMQGTQADQWKAFLSSDISRSLEVKGAAKYLDYSDNNDGIYLSASAGYAITDFPRIFKIIVSEEYRDTRDNYLELYFDNPRYFANIIHPYWCPRNYTAEAITFEWFHDISRLHINGTQRHFYDIRLSFGTDSENDPATRLEAEWRYEFLKHLSTGLRGMIHRSKEWDAESVFADLRYRF